jgi:predicted nucleotidyltransferase
MDCGVHRAIFEGLIVSASRLRFCIAVKFMTILSDRCSIECLTVDEVRESLSPVLRRYGVLKAIVFGSVARGEPSPHSDVDLIVVQRTDKRFFDRYEGLFVDLNRAIPHRSVDVLIYTPVEMESMQRRRFIAAALREGVVIYESE